MNFWINGISQVLRRLSGGPAETDSQLVLELEQANNRIKDLEAENGRFRRVLEVVGKEFGMSADELVRETENGGSSKLRVSGLVSDVKIATKEPEETKKEVVAEEVQQTTAATTTEPTTEPTSTAEVSEAVPEKETKKEGQEQAESASEGSEGEVDTSAHFVAKVRYEYAARKNYELTISVNETITVMSKHENGWWLGCNHEGKQGYFPGSYVIPVESI